MDIFCTAVIEEWEILRQAKGKKIVLFGTGKMAREFFCFHKGHVPLAAVIDNDEKKQRRKLGNVISDLQDPINRKLVIKPVETLNEYNNEDVFVFIANAHPEALIKQLDSLGKCHRLTFARWREDQENAHHFLKINPHKIVFFMYMHGAHEKTITNKLLHYRPGLDIVWVVTQQRQDAPAGVRVVTADRLFDCRYEAASARVWVTGLELLNDYFVKRTNQYYIQVKHWSSLTLKVFGPKCNERVLSEEDYRTTLKAYEINNRKMDFVLTGSAFDEDSCRSGWGYPGQFVRVGSPRSDIMFDPLASKRVYDSIGVDESTHLAMYAPTFRWPFGQVHPLHGLNLDTLYAALRERFGGEWRILLRLHPLVAADAKDIDMPSFVINVSDYDDSEELAAAADVTITDFSSIMFEPAYAYKPVFLYAPDKEEYKNEHPLLLDYDHLPFPVCVTNEELAQAILGYDENDYKAKLKSFFEGYGVHEDGHASERAAKFILDLIDGKIQKPPSDHTLNP